MASKKKKKETKKTKQNPSHVREANSKSHNSWPHLPQKLLNLIEKHPYLLNNSISYAGVCKSWTMSRQHCSSKSDLDASLKITRVSHRITRTQEPHVFFFDFDRPYNWWYYRRYPRCEDDIEQVVSYSHGRLVAVRKGQLPGGFCLYDPVKGLRAYLPPWNSTIPFQFAILSSPTEFYPDGKFTLNKNCFVLALTGVTEPAFAFYRLFTEGEDLCWRYAEDKGPKFQFTNAIGYRGKFFALTLQGTLAVIEAVDSHLEITALSGKRAIPSVSCKHFKEYLVESEGEILLVLLTSRKSIDLVDDVEVFRLQIENLSWVKLTRLGDRALFAGPNSCMSISSRLAGCAPNCVYFTQFEGGSEDWWVFDMETDKGEGCRLAALSFDSDA